MSASLTADAPPPWSPANQLARTAAGKLQEFTLRSPYWEGRDKQVN